MVSACEKNVNQQDCAEVAGMVAKYSPAQRQAKEMMDGQCQGGCRSQRIYTEGDQSALFLDRSQWKNFVTARP